MSTSKSIKDNTIIFLFQEKNNYGQWENPEQLTKKNIDTPNCRQHHFPTKQFNFSK